MKTAALLLALDYKNATLKDVPELHATVHDVHHFQKYLQQIGYKDITIKTDQKQKFTKKTFLATLSAFVKRTLTEALDVAVVYYSGHGTQVPEEWFSNKSKEADGLEECLVMSDDVVSDNNINQVLACVNPTTRFFVVLDCCNSGTACDLQFNYQTPDNVSFDSQMPTLASKVIVLSGCKESETAGEGTMTLINKQGTSERPSGFMTGVLLNILNQQPTLRNSMLTLFESIQNEFAKNINTADSIQTPQLSSSFKLDQNTPFLSVF